MTTRTRLLILCAVAVLAAGGAGVFLVLSKDARAKAIANAPAAASRDDLTAVLAVPHLVFRSTAVRPNYGHVAIAPLSNPDGPRAFTPAECDRVYSRNNVGLCLVASRGVVTTYQTQVLRPDWTVSLTAPLGGLPSRARLSPDGSLTATTTFVFGDSYANPGQFSTRTVIATSADGRPLADVEESFTLSIDGRTTSAVDRNIWGVTFADNDRFYATAATGGKTYLVRGSLGQRTLTSVRTDVECPSISPDGTRIAFKKHGNLPAGQWRLAVYDLASGKETMLVETHSVDDQVEWLDNDHILYGLPRASAGSASSDLWTVPADGTGTPQILVHDAWSPAVVR